MSERLKRANLFDTYLSGIERDTDTPAAEFALSALRKKLKNERYTTFETAIDDAAVEAYRLFSNASKRPERAIRTKPGSCVEMSFILQKLMEGRGFGTDVQFFYEPVFFHYFLTGNQGNVEYFIDPTWQQLLPRGVDVSTLPRVLILPKEQAPEIAQAHGIPKKLSTIWSNGKNNTIERPDFKCNSLEKVFFQQGWI